MVELPHKVKNSLDEARTLVLGAQILIGFQYQSVFSPGFEKLPEPARYLQMAALGLLLCSLCLLLAPVTYHELVDRGESRPDFLVYVHRTIALALVPFAVGFGGDLYIAVELVCGRASAVAAGLLTAFLALLCWYGLGWIREHKPRTERQRLDAAKLRLSEVGNMEAKGEREGQQAAGLQNRVDDALTECRVVLPGAQALLGFQFTAMLAQGFEQLPAAGKYVHVASLALIALATILLMTPAAYHRLAKHGSYSEELYRFTSRLLLASMVPLALGICGDFLVVLLKVTHSAALSTTLALAMLCVFLGLWFGYTAYCKRRHERPEIVLPSGRPADQRG